MGVIGKTWLPVNQRRGAAANEHAEARTSARDQLARHLRERFATGASESALISLAALVGSPVTNPAGESVGELKDVVVRWTKTAAHPAASAFILRAGKRDFLISARWIEIRAPALVRLKSSAAYTRSVERHHADVALAHDVLDRQIIDIGGRDVVRPSDVYLLDRDDALLLIGIEVGARALFRRLGPQRLRTKPRPERVIDWAAVRSFSITHDESSKPYGRRSDLAGRAGSGLELNVVATDLHKLGPEELHTALESSRAKADGSSP